MSFGGWAISEELYDWLVENVPAGVPLLELGSGDGTEELIKRWTVCSIEHDVEYVGKVSSVMYVHAPLVAGWYHPGLVEQVSRKPYGALLIDGPPGKDRLNFIHHMDLFDQSVPWAFDDLHRHADLKAAAKVASARECALEVHRCADGKSFGVIRPDIGLPA